MGIHIYDGYNESISVVTLNGANVLKDEVNVLITCEVDGLLLEPDEMVWKDSSGGTDLSSLTSDYLVTTNALSGNTKTSTLQILKPSSVTTTYYCSITSSEWLKTNDEHLVTVNVYGMIIYRVL